MTKTTNNEFIGLSGEKILVNLSNNQENCEPMKYICLKADLCVLLAISQNKTKITTSDCEDLIKIAISEKFGIAIDNIDFGRAMTKNIRNISTHEKQQTAYKLLMAEPIKTDIKPLSNVQNIINGFNSMVMAKVKSGEIVDYVALEIAIKREVTDLTLQTEVLKALMPKSENTTKDNKLDFSF